MDTRKYPQLMVAISPGSKDRQNINILNTVLDKRHKNYVNIFIFHQPYTTNFSIQTKRRYFKKEKHTHS